MSVSNLAFIEYHFIFSLTHIWILARHVLIKQEPISQTFLLVFDQGYEILALEPDKILVPLSPTQVYND